MGACVEAASGIRIVRLPKADMQITCEVGQHGHYLAILLVIIHPLCVLATPLPPCCCSILLPLHPLYLLLLLLVFLCYFATQVGNFPGMIATPAEWADNAFLKQRLATQVITCHYADPVTMRAIHDLLAKQLAVAGAADRPPRPPADMLEADRQVASETAAVVITEAAAVTGAAAVTEAAAVMAAVENQQAGGGEKGGKGKAGIMMRLWERVGR